MRFIFVICLLLLTGCGQSRQSSQTSSDDGRLKPQAQRLLGLGVTEGAVGFETAFGVAKSAGVQFNELPQQWDEVEQSNGQFESPFLTMANEVYPALETGIVLSLNPIDTSSLRIPQRLIGRRFDEPEFIDAFNQFVDFAFVNLPDANILAVSVGNEADVWLAEDTEKWRQYATFFAAVRDHIRTNYGDIPVGVKATWSATVNSRKEQVAALNKHADAVMVTYYPLNDDFRVRSPSTVTDDLERLLAMSGDKPVFLLETGYPSGADCGSSPEKQADFISAIFSVWDEHADAMPMVNFVWLHDLSHTEVDKLTTYYSIQAAPFRSFLATLGLRDHEGNDKPAFERLKSYAADRGWGE